MNHISDRVIDRLRDLWTIPKLVSHLNKRFGLSLDESTELFFDELYLAIANNEGIRSGTNLADRDLRNLIGQIVQSFNHDRSTENLRALAAQGHERALQEAIVDWFVADVHGVDHC